MLAARDEGVRRVVFASSSSVYGIESESCRVNEALPPDPISPYGVAKLAAERYCVSFSRVYESLETVVLRYFNVFGPRQSPLLAVRGSGPALHHRDRRRRAGDDLRGRRAVARLHLRRERGGRNDLRGGSRRREWAHLQHCGGLPRDRERTSRTRSVASSASPSSAASRRRAPARSATRGRT